MDSFHTLARIRETAFPTEIFSLSHSITLTMAAQVAEKRDPCQGAASVTLHICSRKGCEVHKLKIWRI
jgi:hypothetical protein